METNVAVLPRGRKNIPRDFRGNVAVFGFYGASPPTESTDNFFRMQTFECIYSITYGHVGSNFGIVY